MKRDGRCWLNGHPFRSPLALISALTGKLESMRREAQKLPEPGKVEEVV